MENKLNFYTKTPLVFRIVIGLVAGGLLGVFLPGFSAFSLLGELFVGLLKAIAPLLVFVLVIASLCTAGKGIGKRFRRVVFFYLLSTFLAAGVGALGCYLFPAGLPLAEAAEQAPPSEMSEVFISLLSNLMMNPLQALLNGNYVGILFWAVVLGLAFRVSAGEKTKGILADVSTSVSKTVAWVIELAPFGIFGLVYASVGESGLSVFTDYGKILALLVGCMLTVALVVNPVIVGAFLRKNPYPLVFKCLKESGITAFFTRSSAANIPVNMTLCQRLGLDPEYYSISIPLGAVINMNGAAVTITVMSLSAAFSQGVSVNLLSAILLSFVATLGACGASGVTGGSLLLIPMACSLLGVGETVAMQVVAVGFIIGVVQDSLETALNSSGDVLFCATAEFIDWRKAGKKLPF